MKRLASQDPKTRSPDLVAENIEQLKDLSTGGKEGWTEPVPSEHSACQVAELQARQCITCRIGNRAVIARVRAGAVWVSQKELAKLYSTTPQAITIHISKMKAAGMEIESKCIRVQQIEGRRSVVRNVTHYGINVVHEIAIRAQSFDDFNTFLAEVGDYGISISRTYIVTQRQQRGFVNLILRLLDGIAVVRSQYRVGPHFIDLYLPEFGVAVEYDEAHHSNPANQKADAMRQEQTQKRTGCTFIRVSADDEIVGINQLLRLIWNRSRHSFVPSSKNAGKQNEIRATGDILSCSGSSAALSSSVSDEPSGQTGKRTKPAGGCMLPSASDIEKATAQSSLPQPNTGKRHGGR